MKNTQEYTNDIKNVTTQRNMEKTKYLLLDHAFCLTLPLSQIFLYSLCSQKQISVPVFSFLPVVELWNGSENEENIKIDYILYPWFQTILQTTVINKVWYKNWHIGQWNRIDSPVMNSHLYEQLIYDQGGKDIQWRKDSIFNKLCWNNWTATCKRIKLDYFLTPYAKINSEWIKDLNVRPETIKLLVENIGSMLTLILAIFFLDMFPPARRTKTKTNKWDYLKLKSFHTAEEIFNKMKRPPIKWYLQIFGNGISSKRLISKIYKELIQLSLKKISNLIKKWLEELNRHFSKEDIFPTGTRKDAPHCSLSGKCKSKPQWDITSHLTEWLLPGRQK